jgi:primase-polymerase (primpol)-like protein
MDTYGLAAAGEAANDEARPEGRHDGMPAIEEMKTLGARFVCWKNVPKPGKDGVVKIAKVPFTPDGSADGWTNPLKWGTFQECIAKAKATNPPTLHLTGQAA